MEIDSNAEAAPQTRASFNGAITFSLWKLILVCSFLFVFSGFNGAITFSLWKYTIPRRKSRTFFSFNGAITFSLWKYKTKGDTWDQDCTLQWGHNFFVMEISLMPLYSWYIPKLQWGHNFFVMEIVLNLVIRVVLHELQWGHNFFVMEIYHVVNGVGGGRSRFNGAITFSLWKFPDMFFH